MKRLFVVSEVVPLETHHETVCVLVLAETAEDARRWALDLPDARAILTDESRVDEVHMTEGVVMVSWE